MEVAIGRYIYRDGDDVLADGCPFCVEISLVHLA